VFNKITTLVIHNVHSFYRYILCVIIHAIIVPLYRWKVTDLAVLNYGLSRYHCRVFHMHKAAIKFKKHKHIKTEHTQHKENTK